MLVALGSYHMFAQTTFSTSFNSGVQFICSQQVNFEIAEAGITASVSEDLQPNTVYFHLNPSVTGIITNVTIWQGGVQYGPTVNPFGAMQVAIQGSPGIPAGTSEILTFNADVIGNSGDIFSLTIDSIRCIGLTTGTAVTLPANFSGKTFIIQSCPALIADFSLSKHEFCYGEIIAITNHSIAPGNAEYQWEFGWNSQPPNIIGDTSVFPNTFTVQFYQTGTYNVDLWVTNHTTGQSSHHAETVQVRPNPSTTSITASGLLGCNGATELTLTANTLGGINTYTWMQGTWGGPYDTLAVNGDSTLMVTTPGEYFVVPTNVYGCSQPYPQPYNVSYVQNPSVELYVTNLPGTWIQIPQVLHDTAYACEFSLSQLQLGVNAWVPMTGSQGLFYEWNDSSHAAQFHPLSGSGNSEWYYVSVTNTNGCTTVDSLYLDVVHPTAPTITALGPTTFCEGDHVSLLASGSPGLQYYWNYGAPGDSVSLFWNPGPIVAFTIDAYGCRAQSDTVFITILPVPQKPTILVNGCNLVSDAVSNNTWFYGTQQLSYTGSVITPDSSGIFITTVTGVNGCSATSDPVAFQVPPLPQITVSDNNFCEGGSSTLAVGPGTDFVWSNGQTGSPITVETSGTYSATVTNGTCVRVATPVTITVFPKPNTTIDTVGTMQFCQGGSVTLLLQESGSVYDWNTNEVTQEINVTQSGSFRAHITNIYGCEAYTDVVTVFVHPLPDVDPILVTNCLLAAPYGAATYQWLLFGDTISGATNRFCTADTNGIYECVLTSQFGCEAYSLPTVVTCGATTGITEITEDALALFPNPTTGLVTVKPDLTLEEEVFIYSITGDIVRKEPKGTKAFDISNLADGMYTVRIGNSITKLVKQ